MPGMSGCLDQYEKLMARSSPGAQISDSVHYLVSIASSLSVTYIVRAAEEALCVKMFGKFVLYHVTYILALILQ